MGWLAEYGGTIGWELKSWIMEGKACKSSGVDLNEMMRYEERISLDLRLRGHES